MIILKCVHSEEFSHLEVGGATIQMLLACVNGELKDAADQEEIMSMFTMPFGITINDPQLIDEEAIKSKI